MRRLLIAVIALVPSCAFGQARDSQPARLDSEFEKRIANFNKQFERLMVLTPSEKAVIEACKVNCSSASVQIQDESRRAAANRAVEMDRVASHIHSEVDAYIARAVHPNRLDRRSVEQDLKRILAQVYDEPPTAFTLNATKGLSLVVVYTLRKGTLMGPGATSVTVRAYNATDGRLRLADVTGDNLDGYGGVSVKKLNSPNPGGMWLLLWGQMTGANGPNIRMRVYAYDGKKFRTMWMPANVWGTFKIQVSDHGFTVDGHYYKENRMRHDRYFLAADGLYR